MFTAKVFRIMVGSLSGTMEEVYVAKETIRKWNIENAEHTGKLFLPVDWSSKPEEFKEVDVVIGIVGNWIDDTSFIENCIKSGKKVFLFFKTFPDPTNTIPSEQEIVESFKNKKLGRSFNVDYNNIAEFSDALNDRLFSIGY